MSLNVATKQSFKDAAKAIFDSMVVRTDEVYQEPLGHDPVTGVPPVPVEHPVRMYGATVASEEGLDQEVRIGDRIFYLEFDELPIVPVEKGMVFFETVFYQIYRVETDAAEAVHKCFARIP